MEIVIVYVNILFPWSGICLSDCTVSRPRKP